MRRFVAEATGVTPGIVAAVDRWIPTALPGPSAATRRIRARGSRSATSLRLETRRYRTHRRTPKRAVL